MKKTKSLLIALAIVCVYASASAQAEVAIGLKGGPNFSNVDTKSTAGENYNSRTGFHFGAFTLIKLTKIGVQPEILFSQQGTTVRVNSKDYNSNYTYINIPVMLKIYLAAGLNLQLGPQFGFLTKAEREAPTVTGTTTTEDIKDELKGSDLSAGFGAGWDLPFGLTIDARYNLGLSKINDKSTSQDAKNQVFQVSLGYKLFKLGN